MMKLKNPTWKLFSVFMIAGLIMFTACEKNQEVIDEI